MLLALDVGGTAVKMGLVDESGVIHERAEAAVAFDHYQTPILQTVLRESRTFLDKTGQTVRGIGVSATGQVDEKLGCVIGTNGKIPGYEGSAFKDELEKQFSVPAAVLNDANAAVLGECFIGRAKGYRDVVMLTLGTGVGGGMVLGGKLYSGARGIAGELGHFTLYQDGLPCACGKRGCLENYASATALVRRAEEKTGRTGLNGRIIFSEIKAGNAALKEVLDRWIADVAAGITGLVHIFNPQMVLIGGGISAQEELLMKPLRHAVLTGVMPRFSEGLQVERAALGNDAGMIGAAKFYLDCEEDKLV